MKRTGRGVILALLMVPPWDDFLDRSIPMAQEFVLIPCPRPLEGTPARSTEQGRRISQIIWEWRQIFSGSGSQPPAGDLWVYESRPCDVHL